MNNVTGYNYGKHHKVFPILIALTMLVLTSLFHVVAVAVPDTYVKEGIVVDKSISDNDHSLTIQINDENDDSITNYDEIIVNEAQYNTAALGQCVEYTYNSVSKIGVITHFNNVLEIYKSEI